ncbi:MAG: metal ABC transporter permease [bacterium]
MIELIQSPIFQMVAVSIAVGLAAALLGVFVILRKLSYFPDALAHAGLAGVALGLLLNVNIILGAAVFSLLMAFGIAFLERKKIIGLDTIIVIFFSTSLALAIIIAEFLRVSEEDLIGYLFGDISKINFSTFILAVIVALLVSAILIMKFKNWTKISFHPDLAAIEGIKVKWENYLFMLLLALFVAISLRVVGTVLVGPLLVIPAAAASNFGRSFKGVFIATIVFSLASVIVGLAISGIFHISVGPLIVLVAAAFFGLSLLFKR